MAQWRARWAHDPKVCGSKPRSAMVPNGWCFIRHSLLHFWQLGNCMYYAAGFLLLLPLLLPGGRWWWWWWTAHRTQNTAHRTQHTQDTAHSTQHTEHTKHSTQHTEHSKQNTHHTEGRAQRAAHRTQLRVSANPTAANGNVIFLANYFHSCI